jgi:hypothetical protein
MKRRVLGKTMQFYLLLKKRRRRRRRREEAQNGAVWNDTVGSSFSPGRVEAGEEESYSPASAPLPLSPKTQKTDKDPHVPKL